MNIKVHANACSACADLWSFQTVYEHFPEKYSVLASICATFLFIYLFNLLIQLWIFCLFILEDNYNHKC